MKRFISILLITVLAVTMIFSNFSFAAETVKANIKLSVNPSTIKPGTTFTLIFDYTCPQNTAYLAYKITYNPDYLSCEGKSGTISEQIDPQQGADTKHLTQKYTFTARKVGSSAISVSDIENYILDSQSGKYNDEIETTANKLTVNVTADNKSANCNLKDISPQIGKLSPSFSKDVLSYKIEVPAGTSECCIYADAEDSKANVSISGSEKLSDGDNKRTITVTAESGATKKYEINVIRAKATPKPTANPTAKPTATSVPTSTPEATAGATEIVSASPETSPEETIIPETVIPSETPEVTPIDTDEDGDVLKGEIIINDVKYEIFELKTYLERQFPEDKFLESENFLFGAEIVNGMRAYYDNPDQYLILARTEGAGKQIYLVDKFDENLMRYVGGNERLVTTFDVLEDPSAHKRSDSEVTDETPVPTDVSNETPDPVPGKKSEENKKPIISFIKNNNIVFIALCAAAAILLFILVLFIVLVAKD